MHGWLILDKPVGPGSTQAVSAVKRALRAGGYPRLKVGHGGTLDPLASGVLPVAIGEATKLAGRLLDASKVYQFTIRFGEQTDTLDAEGQVVATSDVRPRRGEVEAVLARFTGAIEQVPPAFSALKIDGRRAYDLARAGETVTLATRAVTIASLEVGEMVAEARAGDPPPDLAETSPVLRAAYLAKAAGRFEPVRSATFTAHVSKGTYIRSLARDIALALGTVGHVTMLRRTRAGPFHASQAITLDKLAELGQARGLEQVLLPLRAGLVDIPALSLTPDQAGALRQGRALVGIAADASSTEEGLCLAMLDDVPVALAEVKDREVRVVRGFNLS